MHDDDPDRTVPTTQPKPARLIRRPGRSDRVLAALLALNAVLVLTDVGEPISWLRASVIAALLLMMALRLLSMARDLQTVADWFVFARAGRPVRWRSIRVVVPPEAPADAPEVPRA